jgi:D-aminopeptidase
MRITLLLLLLAIASPAMSQPGSESTNARPRARDIGLIVGILPTGPFNAITDVDGVRVGHTTLIEGDSVRTGVTAVLPHGGNIYRERVPAAIYVGNGFGKLLGVTQVRELGELETPILLTCTLCVWRAADAMVDMLLEQPDMQDVRSINAVVGETNDGYLNDIRTRPITPENVRHALSVAATGPVLEGSVGAGTGTRAFGWKGGIGTSSRALPASMGGYTVGVLIQSNFGGVLTINGAPVGRELDQYAFKNDLGEQADGSIMMVVATDAPLDARMLDRLAKRAMVGLSRTGASMTNGSGDYVIAFSTTGASEKLLDNNRLSPLFQAVAEATEEAIYNSLFRATTVHGHQGTVEALPLEETLAILRKYKVLGWDQSVPPDP